VDGCMRFEGEKGRRERSERTEKGKKFVGGTGAGQNRIEGRKGGRESRGRKGWERRARQRSSRASKPILQTQVSSERVIVRHQLMASLEYCSKICFVRKQMEEAQSRRKRLTLQSHPISASSLPTPRITPGGSIPSRTKLYASSICVFPRGSGRAGVRFVELRRVVGGTERGRVLFFPQKHYYRKPSTEI